MGGEDRWWGWVVRMGGRDGWWGWVEGMGRGDARDRECGRRRL